MDSGNGSGNGWMNDTDPILEVHLSAAPEEAANFCDVAALGCLDKVLRRGWAL